MTTQTQLETENLQMVKGCYEAFDCKDIKHIIDHCSPNVKWQDFCPKEAAYSGLRKGPGEVGRFFQDLARGMEFETFKPSHFLVNGDKVVVIGRYAGKVTSTGKRFEGGWVHVSTVRNGKILAWNGYHEYETLKESYSK